MRKTYKFNPDTYKASKGECRSHEAIMSGNKINYNINFASTSDNSNVPTIQYKNQRCSSVLELFTYPKGGIDDKTLQNRL